MKSLITCLLTFTTLFADINEFAFAFNQRDEQSNKLFSPYSIYDCIAMTYVGARSQTADEIQKTLQTKLSADELAASLGSYRAPVQMANHLWVSDKIALLPDYKESVAKNFQAGIENIAFSDPKVAAGTINEWVREQTHGKIDKLISSFDIDENTRLVLTNAVYYRGHWSLPFDPKNTHSAPFYSTQITEKEMMSQTSYFPYLETASFQLVSLPLKTMPVSLMILLPKHGIDSLRTQLNAHNFESWIDHLSQSRIDLYLPRFSIEEKIDLEKALKKMGMKSAFSDNADFSGITGQKDLSISKAIHEAYIDVNEGGVVAAAATAITMNFKSSLPDMTPSTVFNANKPFLFFLVDTETKTILFIGELDH
jgi:serpin B